MQLTASADTVSCVAAVNMTKVKRGVRHGKCLIVIAFFKSVTQLQDMTDGIMHQFNSIYTTSRITGVPRLPHYSNRVGDMTFMRSNRLQ